MEGAKILKVLMAAVFLPSVSAANVVVGGSTGWDLSTNFTQWSASSSPIFVDDTLLFNYTQAHNVIEVNEVGFSTCNTSRAISTAYEDGLTMVKLTESGSRFFVCGRADHCIRGLKLQVRVLDRPQRSPDTRSPDNNRSGSGDSPDGPCSCKPSASRLVYDLMMAALYLIIFLLILGEICLDRGWCPLDNPTSRSHSPPASLPPEA